MDRRGAVLGGLCLAGAHALHGFPTPAIAQGRPGPRQVLLDHLQTAKARAGRCGISNSLAAAGAPPPEPLVDLRQRGMSEQTLRMCAYSVLYSTRWFFGGDRSAGERAISAIHAWARGDSHQRVVAPYTGSSERWPSYTLMTSILNALILLDNHPDFDARRKEEVASWVERTLERSWIFGNLPRGGAGHEDTEQRVNNHNARRALVLLYYGIYFNSPDLIRRSSSNLQRTFNAYDRNGVPYDANRGDWALWYINFGIDSAVLHQSLTYIVDRRLLRGENLSKLDLAAEFLFREAENPREIHRYASANIGRPQANYGGRQDMSWLQPKDGGFLWWAYVDTPIFRGAMPKGRQAATALLGNSQHWRRPKSSDTGGAVSCWYAA